MNLLKIYNLTVFQTVKFAKLLGRYCRSTKFHQEKSFESLSKSHFSD